ncbi:hypothetical protein [Modestobacter excelsi]|uniref:hypothetical protein n=1 Tax=Modestobacter excelsi TaxID=2213161 RepID=UPI00110C8E2F|nr:hypothetical protein [Modestobacter excelsi]
MLKTAVTGWRMLRCYARGRTDRAAGPLNRPLRILGPFVVLATLALLGSRLTLMALGEQRSRSSSIPLFGDWGGASRTPAPPARCRGGRRALPSSC